MHRHILALSGLTSNELMLIHRNPQRQRQIARIRIFQRFGQQV